MAGFFDFLGDTAKGLWGAPGAISDFYKNDPAAFSILMGNLGNIFGTGNPALEKAGQFGAGLGYSKKLNEQSKSQGDLMKNMLQYLLNPNTPISGLSSTGKGLKVDFQEGMTPFNSETSSQPGAPAAAPSANVSASGLSDIASALSGTPGGGADTAPFLPGLTQGSRVSSDIISSLLGALSTPAPSLEWLTPEMAMNVMSQKQNERQLATSFAQALRSQDIAVRGQDIDLAELGLRYGGTVASDEVPITLDPKGNPIYDPKGQYRMKASALASYNQGQTTESRLQTAATDKQTQDYIDNLADDVKSIYDKYTDVPQGMISWDRGSGAYRQLLKEAEGGNVEAQGDLRRVNVLMERKRAASMRINSKDIKDPAIMQKLKSGNTVTLSRKFRGILEPIKIDIKMTKDGRIVVVNDNGAPAVY